MKWFTIDDTWVVIESDRGVDKINNPHNLIIRREGKLFAVYKDYQTLETFKEYDHAQNYINSFSISDISA